VEREISIDAPGVSLRADLALPDDARGLVIFAHGSGSSRHSPRNRAVARALQRAGLSTLLMDLLTAEEEREDLATARLRFDIPLLAERLTAAIGSMAEEAETAAFPIGAFGASTGAAAALVAAARRPDVVRAIVSRGGRPDLAEDDLSAVRAPTLLVVGSRDEQVLEMNRQAMSRMDCEVSLEVVPGATHLFEEPGALDQVARHASRWFVRHLADQTAA
jgi:dienelactone hydrolase